MPDKKLITIFDTSVASLNIGDQIIMDAVQDELHYIFKDNYFFAKVPTHEVISRKSRKIIKSSLYSFVAGTNLLNSHYRIIRNNSWNLKIQDILLLNEIILFGVGWGAYQNNPSLLSKIRYKSILHKELLHSVRDNYTKQKLQEAGINNVLNTGCPTLWRLTDKHCREIPTKKAENAVITFTDYNQDFEKDQYIFDIIKKNYKKIYIWLQGSRDLEYVKKLSVTAEVIPPRLKSFDDLLESDTDIDYVGTRLHAGIRAMQKKRRSIIIGIDNRALEMKKDIGLNVIDRKAVHLLNNYINSEFKTSLNINWEAIKTWKGQFYTSQGG